VFFLYNPASLAITIVSMLVAVAAQMGVRNAYAKYSRMQASCRLSGAEVARRMVAGSDVKIVQHNGGQMSDHFDPRTNTIALSPEVFSGSTVAALGIAAHEAGHALQYSQGYAPIRLRNGILPVARFGSMLAMPLVLMGIFIETMPFLIDVGIALFVGVLLFQLVTLPVEFNASRRAVAILNGWSYLTPEESKGAKAMLRAAAMTYVAAVVTALLQLLRLLMLANRRR
jgi:hypothetical protein